MNTLYKPFLFRYKQLTFYSNINIIYKINKYKLSKNVFIKKIYFLHKNNYLFNKIIIYKKFIYLKNQELHIKLSHLRYNHEYIDSLKELGFFQFVKYSTISFKKNNYDIFYLKYNPIITKINIKNYTALKIPKYIIIEHFYKYIGTPINYKLFEASIQYIYNWYINKGFKWAKIKYFYNIKNHQITIAIDEGEIKNIYLKLCNQNKILSVTLQNEFYLIDQHIITSYILENYLSRIKDKYNIHYIEYCIKPKTKGLYLVITYSIYDNKYQEHYMNYIIKYSKQYFTNITTYIYQLYNKYNYKPTKLLFSILPIYLSHLTKIQLIQVFYKYNLFYINKYYKNIIYWIEIFIFHNIYFIKLNMIITMLKKINILLLFTITNINIKDHIFSKNVNMEYITISLSKYLYKITNLEIKLQIGKTHLHHFILKNYQFHQKNIKMILYATIKYIKYNYHIYHLQYIKYKLKYYNLNFYRIYLFKSNAIINIKYQLYLCDTNMPNYLIKLFQYYFHTIKIQYEQFYSMKQRQFIHHHLNIFAEINIVAHNLQTNQIFIDYICYIIYNKISYFKYHILYDIEYQIFCNNYNYLYLFLNYLPIKNKFLIYTQYNHTKDIKKYLKIGAGIHIHIPVKSIPIIRLETKIIDYHKILFYTYLSPKLYK